MGLQVIIPSKLRVLLLLFMGAWLVGWAFGETFAIRQIQLGDAGPGRLFLTIWLTMWTIGGGWAVYTMMWMLTGREVVLLRPDALCLKRELLGLGRTKEFDLALVKNLRVSPAPADPFNFSASMRFWGIGGGTIAFDYGARTFRFGSSVDEAEAAQIVADLTKIHSFGAAAMT